MNPSNACLSAETMSGTSDQTNSCLVANKVRYKIKITHHHHKHSANIRTLNTRTSTNERLNKKAAHTHHHHGLCPHGRRRGSQHQPMKKNPTKNAVNQRYLRGLTVPKASNIPTGHVLVHNHVWHTTRTPHVANGFPGVDTEVKRQA